MKAARGSPRASEGTACFSIGYQGRSSGELVELLHASGVEILIDVRASAWSYRPEYRKAALRMAVEARGIRYVHLEKAGNPFRPRNGEQLTFEECGTRYRQFLRNNQDVVMACLNLLQDGRAAVLCYEAQHSGCHRSILLEEVAMADSRLQVAEL